MNIDELLRTNVVKQVQQEAQSLPATPAPNLLGATILSVVLAVGGVTVPFAFIYALPFVDSSHLRTAFLICLILYFFFLAGFISNIRGHYVRFKTMHDPKALLSAYEKQLVLLTKRELMEKFSSKEAISEEEVIGVVSQVSRTAWTDVFDKLFYNESSLRGEDGSLRADSAFTGAVLVSHLAMCGLWAVICCWIGPNASNSVGGDSTVAVFQQTLFMGIGMLTIVAHQILTSVYDRAAFKAWDVLDRNFNSTEVNSFLVQLNLRNVLVPMLCVGSFLAFYRALLA